MNHDEMLEHYDMMKHTRFDVRLAFGLAVYRCLDCSDIEDDGGEMFP